MNGLTEASRGYLAAFDRSTKTRDPRWLADARRDAMRRFEDVGFPGPKNEDWKYTGVTPLVAQPFHAAVGRARPAYDRGAVERRIAGVAIPDGAVRLVFVDGVFDSVLSDDSGTDGKLLARSLAADLAAADSIAATRFGRGFDVGAVARIFGGGGHAAAAGLTYEGDRDSLLAELLPLLPGGDEA